MLKKIVNKVVILLSVLQLLISPSVIFAEQTLPSDLKENNSILKEVWLEENSKYLYAPPTSDKASNVSPEFYSMEDVERNTQETNSEDDISDLEKNNQSDGTLIKDSTSERKGTNEIKTTSVSKLSDEQEAVKKRIALQIESMTFDDVLNDFGGRRVISNAFKDKEMHVQVSDENVDLDKMQLDSSFQELKENRIEFLDEILVNFSDFSTLSPTDLEEKLNDTLKQLMMVKIYIERWYGIEIEGAKLSDSLYYDFETSSNVLEIASQFKKNPQLMDSNSTAKTYQSELKVYFQFQTVKELVESFVTENAKITDYNSWFKGYFGGSVIELKATIQQLEISTWDKISENTSDLTSENHLLPILTMKNPQNMIIANCQGLIIYSTKHNFENYEKEVLQALRDFDYYLNTLINTQYSEANRSRIISNLNTVTIFDSEITDENYNYFDEENSLSNGFFQVLHQLTSINYKWWVVNAIANGREVTFIQAILTNNYGGTLAHEYFHNTGGIVMNSGNSSTWGYRSSWQVEVIPARIDYTWFYEEGVILNLYEEKAERYNGLSNSGGRFQEPKDLQEFYGGVMGLIYGLNVVVADVVLSLPVDEQVGYVRLWDKNTNTISTLTKEQLIKMNLTTVQDLVDESIGIFDKSIPDGPTPDNYGGGSSFYSLDSHYFISEDGIYASQVNEFPYMVQMVDELFSLNTYSGWDAVNLFFANGTGAITNLDALQLVMKDPTYTFKKFREMQLTTYGSKLKSNGFVDDTYENVYKEIKNNLTDLRNVKEKFYEKYNKLTNEFRMSVFEAGSQPLIEAPYIKAVNTFSTELNITSPKLEDGFNYELIVLVNDSEVNKVSIISEEVVTFDIQFNKGDRVTAYIERIDEGGGSFKGEEAHEIVTAINSEDLIIPPLNPAFPEIESPFPENPDLGKGLSILYVSGLVFPKIESKSKNQTIAAFSESGNKNHIIAIANYKTGTKKARQWSLQVSQEQIFDNGVTLTLSPFVDESYQMDYGVSVKHEKIHLNNEPSLVARADGSGNAGIIPIGMGEVNLEVPGNVALGTSTATVKWILVSEPESK